MVNRSTPKKKPLSADWFVQGVLTKLGDTFDRLIGRGWKPSSSLATSQLAERLKSLIDTEARETADKRKFVPHNIQLKMQWDKFSTDSEDSLRKLEHELLTSLIDHINDRRYYTYAPISLTVKPDYFTNGVKLLAGFESQTEDESEVSLDVTAPHLKVDISNIQAEESRTATALTLRVRFDLNGKAVERSFEVTGGRRLSIGRGNENDIAINDNSVSKLHASLKLDAENRLIVADTGSTNGTFIDGERIAYGKASTFPIDSTLRVGAIDLAFQLVETVPVETGEGGPEGESDIAGAETYAIGEFEFTKKIDAPEREDNEPAPTAPGITVPEAEMLKPLERHSNSADARNGIVDPDDDTFVTK
jgi:hypothetical protein